MRGAGTPQKIRGGEAGAVVVSSGRSGKRRSQDSAAFASDEASGWGPGGAPRRFRRPKLTPERTRGNVWGFFNELGISVISI